MKKFFPIFLFSLCLIYCTTNFASANEWTFADKFNSQYLGDVDGQDSWSVTNYSGNPKNAVTISTSDVDGEKNYVEITNDESVIVSRIIRPIKTGVFQLRMRHNKAGLFYLNVLTSDGGGQLLFSVQFTEAAGILLEESNRQITLLSDYTADQWYVLTIDFDNTRSERGTFKIKIDDGEYAEYDYVASESTAFDVGQLVFGSYSNARAISAFSDIKPITIIDTITVDTDVGTSSITTVDIDGKNIVISSTDVTTDTPNNTPDTIVQSSAPETTSNNQSANVFTIIDDIINIIQENPPAAPPVEPPAEPLTEPLVTPTVSPEVESLTQPASSDIGDSSVTTVPF